MGGTGFKAHKAQEEGSIATTPVGSQSEKNKPRISPWMLTGRTSAALAIAFLISVIPAGLCAPFMMRFTFAQSVVYSIQRAPSDDAAMQAWAQAKPEFSKFQIEREGNRIVIRYEYKGKLPFGQERSGLAGQVRTQLQALGYEARPLSASIENVDFLGEALRFAVGGPFLLLAGQAGMLIVAIWNIRRLAKKWRTVLPLFAAPWGKAALWGAVVGAALLAFGFVHDVVLRWALGHEIPSPWNMTQSLSGPAKLWLLLLGAVGAPVAEEVFFRGYMFGSFKREGYIGCGMVISALIFALVHFADPYHMGAIVVIGLALAWSLSSYEVAGHADVGAFGQQCNRIYRATLWI